MRARLESRTSQTGDGAIDHRDPFHIGDWLVNPSLNRLSRGQESVQLEIKMMEVLVCLADHAGELVTRRDLVDEVWATEFISDTTLTRAIAELRKALGDNARTPAYIETIHRRGYRLIAPVTRSMIAPQPSSQRLPRFRVLMAGAEMNLAEGENVIGRSPEATVHVDSSKVSRCHARIVVEGETATLEDLGSKNGTFLNGELLTGPVSLSNGDEIRIGQSIARIRFVVVDERTMTEHSIQAQD